MTAPRDGFAVLAAHPGDAPGGVVGVLMGTRRTRGGQAGQVSWPGQDVPDTP